MFYRRLAKTIGVIFVGCAFYCIPEASIAWDGYYSENFNDGRAQNWEPQVPSDWSVVSQEYIAHRDWGNHDGWDNMVSTYAGRSFSNFEYEVDLKPSHEEVFIGIIFRATHDFNPRTHFEPGRGSGYMFRIIPGYSPDPEIQPTMQYALTTVVNGEIVNSIWGSSEAINHSGYYWNRLGVVAQGNQIELRANGQILETVTDSRLSSGRIGLIADTWPGISLPWRYNQFDNIAVGYSDAPVPSPTPATISPVIDSGDYTGDGTSDLAVFRPSSGLWAVRGVTRAYFGTSGDLPVPGDYTGDGTTDIAIFRGSSGLWAVRGGPRVYFGTQGDISVPGDYTGDGTVGAAVFRPSSGLWAIRGLTRRYFGTVGDIPVPFYPDGRDFPKQIAIFRPSSGLWAAGQDRVYFGTSGDRPVLGSYEPGDYDPEPSVFRPSSGLWAIRGYTRIYFGGASDQPVPGNYTGFLPDDIGIFRPASGLWAIRGVTRSYFGTTGDIPVSGFSINPSSALVP